VSSIIPSNPYHPVACTTDLWSGSDHDSYIGVTAHWIDADWELRHTLLDIYLCTDRHTGENLGIWLQQVFQDNDLSVRNAGAAFNLLFLLLLFLLFGLFS